MQFATSTLRRSLPLCALALACAAVVPAQAQNTQTPSQTGSPMGGQSGSQSGSQTGSPAMGTQAGGSTQARSNLARGDRTFVEKAAAGGMAEVEAGKLGQQHASSDQVKQFAAKMVEDHTKANDELKTIATSKGLSLPAEPERAQRRHMDSMGKKTGADFDRDYMKQMVDDHKKTVDLFKKQSEDGKDPELKAFATKTLPTLQQHLQMAQQLHDSVKK